MSAFQNYDSRDISVIISELLVASADGSDPLVDHAVGEVLRALRQRLKLDVVFVSEFVDGQRVFRFVDRDAQAPRIEVGDSDSLEATFCHRIVEGRLPGFIADAGALGPDADVPRTPVRIGAHLSTPVVLASGRVYGTLCCFSTQPTVAEREQDMVLLHQCARLVASRLDRAQAARDHDAANTSAPLPKH